MILDFRENIYTNAKILRYLEHQEVLKLAGNDLDEYVKMSTKILVYFEHHEMLKLAAWKFDGLNQAFHTSFGRSLKIWRVDLNQVFDYTLFFGSSMKMKTLLLNIYLTRGGENYFFKDEIFNVFPILVTCRKRQIIS